MPSYVAAGAAIMLMSTFCLASAHAPAPAPAPISGMGQEPAPAPETLSPGPSAPENDCLSPLLNMSDCLSYVIESSNVSIPDKNCCPEFAGLLDGHPICLCELLSNTSLTESYGIKIDVHRAIKLPSVCRLSTPSVSLCSVAGYPVPGPVASEMSPSQTGQESPSSGVMPPEGLASPSTGDNGNGASTIAGSSGQAFFLGLALSYVLTFF